MSQTVLATKLYVPPPRPDTVLRPRLVERLNAGLGGRLTLVAAPAGFGKTTLVSEWVSASSVPVAWLSLDERDSNPTRFLTYLVAALQTVAPQVGGGVLGALQLPQPPAAETILTTVLNDIATAGDDLILVLDDYHVVDSGQVDDAVSFLVQHLPPQLHLVIASREDPQLPLSRLRARGHLTELRANDLRFTAGEAAEFLNSVMGLNLTTGDVAALEARTEGWVAGLQLAAISMRNHDDAGEFIRAFGGSHRYVLDYLMEEVLQQQPGRIQSFLLNTSVLGRMCGPLCDAVMDSPTASGQETLEHLDRANLFIVPLDDERRWFRYHHLFAGLLQQRLAGAGQEEIGRLHVRASEWFEGQGLDFEAFHHAATANDIDRAARLAEGKRTALFVRGAAPQVLSWLESLPPEELDARPSMWAMYAAVLSIVGQTNRVEEMLQKAERVLNVVEPEAKRRDLVGRIADMRALVAVLAADATKLESIIEQSRRALEFLNPDNLTIRAATVWKMGLAYQHLGDHDTARNVFVDTIALAEASGNLHVNILATTCLGRLLEHDTHHQHAEETYRHVLQLVGDPPGPVACEAYAGLARISYERNDLEAARQHGELSLMLARQIDIASFVASELVLARVQIAEGDVDGAVAALARTAQEVQQHANFRFRLPEIAGMQVLALLRQGDVPAAAALLTDLKLPFSQARVHLAAGDPAAALDVLERFRPQVERPGWGEELLRVTLLQALAHRALGNREDAMQLLAGTLEIAGREGFTRVYLDEGPPMGDLLSEAAARGISPTCVHRLLAAFSPGDAPRARTAPVREDQPLVEPLSDRELEILRLIAAGLSNRDIADRLYLAQSTVKGHNRNIFGKLQAQRRTEAIARARDLGLI